MYTLPVSLPSLRLSVEIEKWPISGSFTISRGSKSEAEVVVCTITDGKVSGFGECVPYTRYGESLETVKSHIQSFAPQLASGELTHLDILQSFQPGAARNAIDCALWDYYAKATGRNICDITGLSPLQPQTTAYTISLASPEEMADKTREASQYSLLKIKLGGDGDDERMLAVREAAPQARLIADANEAWSPEQLEHFLNTAASAKYELVEQPLPENHDSLLKEMSHPLPVCADESCHDVKQLEKVIGCYDAINIKLDKTGGFSEALAMARKAESLGLKIMLGCMVGTSLAMAPALYLAQYADWIDLDGPLLLEKDRKPGLSYSASTVSPPDAALWG